MIHNTDFLYYRFHGEEALYASDYSSAQLTDFGELKSNMDIKKGIYIL